MDDSGLGHQTRNLVRALNPDKVIAVDFTFYNGFKQHPWYVDYDTRVISGFITDEQAQLICSETDVVLTAETYYNNKFIDIANDIGTETYNQINYEFFEPLSNRSLTIPSKILMPSYWYLDEMKNLAEGRVHYLPPPTFVEDFAEVREQNMSKSGRKRFLHVAGKMAAHDRAGTKDLINCMSQCLGDFELVIRVQKGEQLHVNDPRIILDYSVLDDERELYRGFDAMIQPRRYAGLNLPMNEALSAGLPVIMTDIPPNNKVLPRQWVVPSYPAETFFARTTIQTHSAYPQYLAAKISEFAHMTQQELDDHKQEALRIAQREYSNETFKRRWNDLFPGLKV